MKKRLLFAIAVCTSIAYTNAQVGINTTDPKTTLHVIGTNDNGAVAAADGVLVPRVNALTVNGTENGQLVFLIADAGTFTKGFHYWDGTAWVPITDAEAIAGAAEIRMVTGGNIISSEAGKVAGVTISAGDVNEDNIAIGRGAGGAQTSGIRNVMIGHNSGTTSAAPGNDNVYLGFNSGRDTPNSGSNVAIGQNSLRSVTGSAGANAIAIGGSSQNGAIASGNDNIAIGRESGRNTTLISNNVLLGTSVANGGTIGSDNVMVGRSNGVNNGVDSLSLGNRNTAVGAYQLTGGAEIGLGNSLFGANVFDTSKLDNNNIGIGSGTGQNMTAGSENILLGLTVADAQTILNNNIAIGNDIDFPVTGTDATASNQLNIQNIIFGTGNSGTGTTVSTAGKIGIGQAAPAERLDVDGTAKANNFRQNIEASETVNKTKGILLADADFSMPAATEYTGLIITVRNVGTTGITFNGGGVTINGVTTNTRTIPVGNTFRFTSDGTEWYIISQL